MAATLRHNKKKKMKSSFMTEVLEVCVTYSEVVEGRVRQAASCYVFGQLVQHLWVLGLRHRQGKDYKADKQHQCTTCTAPHTQTHTHSICMPSHAWPVYCEGWVHGVVWCWSATSLSSSCRQTWTPGTDVLLRTPTAGQRTRVSIGQGRMQDTLLPPGLKHSAHF